MRAMRWRYESGASEIRDGLDASWWRLLDAALPGMPFLPLPNTGEKIMVLLDRIDFSGFVFTGGDDWGAFPARDKTEEIVFQHARSCGLPLLGVCRGAQIINIFMGGELVPVSGHIATRHMVSGSKSGQRQVNSFHGYGITRLGNGLLCDASDENGHIEAWHSQDGLLKGIMWHPERESVFCHEDINVFANMFDRKKQ